MANSFYQNQNFRTAMRGEISEILKDELRKLRKDHRKGEEQHQADLLEHARAQSMS